MTKNQIITSNDKRNFSIHVEKKQQYYWQPTQHIQLGEGERTEKSTTNTTTVLVFLVDYRVCILSGILWGYIIVLLSKTSATLA